MAATDKFNFSDTNLTGPGLQFAAITTSDSVDLSFMTRGIYIGVTGNVVAVDKDNNAVTFTGAVAGTVLPIRARRVNATSTTATGLVAIW